MLPRCFHIHVWLVLLLFVLHPYFGASGRLCFVIVSWNITLSSDAVPNHRHMFGPHKGPPSLLWNIYNQKLSDETKQMAKWRSDARTLNGTTTSPTNKYTGAKLSFTFSVLQRVSRKIVFSSLLLSYTNNEICKAIGPQIMKYRKLLVTNNTYFQIVIFLQVKYKKEWYFHSWYWGNIFASFNSQRDATQTVRQCSYYCKDNNYHWLSVLLKW